MKHAPHQKKVIVQQAEGLKMMLAARVAQSAKQFASHISLMHEEIKVDAKSVLDMKKNPTSRPIEST